MSGRDSEIPHDACRKRFLPSWRWPFAPSFLSVLFDMEFTFKHQRLESSQSFVKLILYLRGLHCSDFRSLTAEAAACKSCCCCWRPRSSCHLILDVSSSVTSSRTMLQPCISVSTPSYSFVVRYTHSIAVLLVREIGLCQTLRSARHQPASITSTRHSPTGRRPLHSFSRRCSRVWCLELSWVLATVLRIRFSGSQALLYWPRHYSAIIPFYLPQQAHAPCQKSPQAWVV